MAHRKPLTSDSTLDRCAQVPGMSTLARAFPCERRRRSFRPNDSYKTGCVELWTADDFYIIMSPATGTIALNNFLQAKGKLASLSWIDTSSGPAHKPEWVSVCKIDGHTYSSGTGTHKHLSRDAAAEQALAILMVEWA